MTIDTSSPITLENERALLRPLALTDLPELEHFAINEPELWEYSLLSAAGSKNMQHYVESALADRAQGHSYPFLVIDKQSGDIAGSTRFYDIQAAHQTTQLGYTWYGKAFQRTGLNRYCKLLMLDYAFDTMKVERVEFRADANNARSIKAMKAIGCIEEGLLRSNCSSPNGRRSSIVLSILKQEWYASVREALTNRLTPSE